MPVPFADRLDQFCDVAVFPEFAFVLDLSQHVQFFRAIEQTNDREMAPQEVLDPTVFGTGGMSKLWTYQGVPGSVVVWHVLFFPAR